MESQLHDHGNVSILEVSGRIDSMNANEFGIALMNAVESVPDHLALDLAGVDYMSSAGLRELVAALKAMKRKGGDLDIVQPSIRVAEVLDMAGLNNIFLIFNSLEEVLNTYN